MAGFVITYDFLRSNGLVNTVGIDIVTYYDPKHNVFRHVNHSVSLRKNGITSKEFDSYVALPYDTNYNKSAWGKFYELLSEDQLILATSYPYRKGYFNYLRETGLIDYYEEARELIAQDVISTWEFYHDISPDWGCADPE